MSPCVGGSRNRLICNGCQWVYWMRPTLSLTVLRSSRVWSSGDRPPWIHRNCLFMIAAKGKLQNDSMQAL